MSTRQIDITSTGDRHLALAMELFWANSTIGNAKFYKVVRTEKQTRYYANEVKERSPGNCKLGETVFFASHHTEEKVVNGEPDTLILLWGEERGAVQLPFPLNLERAIEFVAGWLGEAKYGPQPDHDGSNGKGWRLFNGPWGHVVGHHCGIVGVQTCWMIYPK